MGIKKLFTFLNKHKLFEEFNNFNDLIMKLKKNKNDVIIGIDANLYFYKYVHSYDNYLIGFFNQIITFLSNKLTPFYIFDGSVFKEKEKINNLRNNKILFNKNKLLNLDLDENEKNKIEKNTIKFNAEHITILTTLLELMNVPYIFAYTESDYIAVLLSKYNIIDFFLSDDTDPIVAGIKYIIKFYNNKILYLNTKLIFEKFELTHEQFINVCVLAGSDYSYYNHKLKIDEIIDIVKSNSLINFLAEQNIDIDEFNSVVNIYKNSINFEMSKLLNKNDDYELNIISNNTNNNSSILNIFWNEFIEIFNEDVDNTKSKIFKQIFIKFVKEKKIFNIDVLNFLTNNISNISKYELNNINISIDYLNKFHY